MKIAVIGGGRVGAPVAAGFAGMGHCAVCCERNGEKLRALRSGRAPFDEPGLNALVGKHLRAGNLSFAADAGDAVKDADVCFVAVETDVNGCAGLRAVVAEVAKRMHGRGGVAIKSTMPVGMSGELAKATGARVVVNPEFLRQGFAVGDFLRPSRIVVGADDEHAAMIMRAVYQPWIKNGVKLIETSRASAEIIKLSANFALASRVAVVNEIAGLCESAGADIDEVAAALALDKRIGLAKSGAGFGGVCLPKDCELFAAAGRGFNYRATVAEAVSASNNKRPQKLAAHIAKHFPPGSHPRLAVWGLAFKAGGDDVRNSKAAETARLLGETPPLPSLRLHDPFVSPRAVENAPGEFFCDWRKSIKNADGLVVLAAHPCYADIPRAEITMLMKSGALVFDIAGGLQKTRNTQSQIAA